MDAHPAASDDDRQLGFGVWANGDILDLSDGEHAVNDLRGHVGPMMARERMR